MEGIINFKDWSKSELRVGQILEVKDIEGADQLYKMLVDIGDKKRIICAGIKEYYSKEELKDKKVIVFVNLAPKKMRGIESQGMILAACSEGEKEVVLVSPEKDAEVGWRVY